MALVARAVPEVAWLLLLAAAFGMGTLPALIALIVHATGVLVRLFTEAVDDRFVPALGRALAGGAAVGWLVYVALPRVRGPLSMHTALQAESNLRAAFTLGILGAGGLGESFHTAISFWELERASTLALAMFGLFVVVERLARRLAKF
jgi:phosphonate transport system permease protein